MSPLSTGHRCRRRTSASATASSRSGWRDAQARPGWPDHRREGLPDVVLADKLPDIQVDAFVAGRERNDHDRGVVVRDRGRGHRPRVGLFGMFGGGDLWATTRPWRRRCAPLTRPVRTRSWTWSAADRATSGRGITWRRPLVLSTQGSATGLPGAVLKALVKVADSVRLVDWVRRHDTVIIPGMGVFKGYLQTPPWGEPLRLFLVEPSGSAVRDEGGGYISVGADVVHPQPADHRLAVHPRRPASRPFAPSGIPGRERCSTSGESNVAGMPVYPDLAFALPVPPPQAGDWRASLRRGDGLRGDDRDQPGTTYKDAYVDEMTQFVYWLLTTGRDVRLLVGDAEPLRIDSSVQEIVAAIGQRMPALADGRLAALPAISLDDILAAMSPAGTSWPSASITSWPP